MEDDEFLKDMQNVLLKYLIQNYSRDENGQPIMLLDVDETQGRSILRCIALHLKFFLSTIIQHMAYYRRKNLLYCPLLNGIRDPRLAMEEDPFPDISSVQAYEDIPFTVYDMFIMLKEHQSLIPNKEIYQSTMRRLRKMESVRAILPSERKHCGKKKKESKRKRSGR